MRNTRKHHNQWLYSYTHFKTANVKYDHADPWQDSQASGIFITLLLEVTITEKIC